jgi:hypothetical protein
LPREPADIVARLGAVIVRSGGGVPLQPRGINTDA